MVDKHIRNITKKMVSDNYKTVVLEMLQKRKCRHIQQVPDAEYDIHCVNEDGQDVYVKFLLPSLKLPQHFKKYIESFDSPKDVHHIILLIKKPSSLFRRLCKPYSTELFHIEELQTNITNHVLVPKHQHIRAKEKEKIENICAKYNISDKTKFPIILSSDPVCKFYGGQIGDLFEIHRNSTVSGNYISYRYVDEL